MLAQALALCEGLLEAVHDLLLLGRERIGVCGIHGGEVAGREWQVTACDVHRPMA